MQSETLTILKKMLKYTFRGFVFILLLCLGYLFLALLFSIIPVNRNAATNKEIEIFIRSNGVHLELILPVKTRGKDWSKEINIDPEIANSVRYISFGWGDKIFYYNTPQWSDLTFNTAFKALFLKSQSALHVDYYTLVSTNKLCKPIAISEEQYQVIVNYVESGFQRGNNHDKILIDDLQYSEYDCFYEANGSYNLFFTCNTWTNKCLKVAGLKASLWTPFDRGILYHYRKE